MTFFNLKEILSAEQISDRVIELAKKIDEDFAGQHIVLLCILKGSFIFIADLARAITVPVTIDFLGVQSYNGDTKSSGVVQITQDLTTSITGRNVIIVEDIVDTGLTIHYLINMLLTRNPKTLKICSLLYKPSKVIKPVNIDYIGFTINDLFVVGYGLDYKQYYRNFPGINILEKEENDSI